MLPQSYPNHKKAHRRFQQGGEREILRAISADLAKELRDSGDIDQSECLINAIFASAKGGGAEPIAPHGRVGTSKCRTSVASGDTSNDGW